MLRLLENLPGWRRRHAWLTDVVLVALVCVPPVIREQPGWRPVGVQIAVYAALVLPLLWRRRHPVGVAAVVTAAFWVQCVGQVWGQEPGRGVVAVAAVLYTLVVRGLRRQAVMTAGWAGGCVLLWMSYWLRAAPSADTGRSVWPTLVAMVLCVAGAWLAGEYVRARRALLAEFVRRTELAESHRLALARVAVTEERTRIAREIHDVLAHSVTVMVVNAEGGRMARATDPTAADRSLDVISATGRGALDDLRRLLDVLRAGDGHGDGGRRGETAGDRQPTLADLGTLVGALPVNATVEVRGDATGLPKGAAAQTYWIVREALTNVVKHASPEAVTRVLVDIETAQPGRRAGIRIRVDTSPGKGAAPLVRLPSAGHGLTGMRERAALYGGTVAAAHTADGGYRVAATLAPDACPEPVAR